MSEVKRWKAAEYVPGMWPDNNGGYVKYDDFRKVDKKIDAQRLRADTAEAELKVIKQSLASLKNERAADDRKFECLGEILALLKDHPIVKAHQLHIDAALNPNPEAESHE